MCWQNVPVSLNVCHVLEDADILRNILYVGVWEKYDKKQLEKNKEEE